MIRLLPLSLLFQFTCFPCVAVATDTPSNVTIILVDDLGNADLSYNGCKDLPTSNIDALTKTGMILTDAHSTASVCAPSQAGLKVGKIFPALRLRVQQSEEENRHATIGGDFYGHDEGRRLRNLWFGQIASRLSAGHAPESTRIESFPGLRPDQ